MSDKTPMDILPRGPHDLTREEVENSQRRRLVSSMTQVVGEKGYVKTSVADVIQRAGVSRATFYQLFKDKEDCFIQSFDSSNRDILAAMMEAMNEHEAASLLNMREGDRMSSRVLIEQLSAVLRMYLHVLSSYPQVANTFLVEVYAAGPRAIQKRRDSLETLIRVLLARVFPFMTTSPRREFAIRTLVHGISSMVTMAVGTENHGELEDLHGPIMELVSMMVRSELFAGAFEAS